MRRKPASENEVHARLEQARRYFRSHHAGVEPDAAFAARVTARLPTRQADVIGRLSLQLLPAAWILAAMLSWLVLQQPRTTEPRDVPDAAPSEDVLSWLLEDDEVLP